MSKSNHVFTGVFIPAHIWLSSELIPAEKMMLGEIAALSIKSGWCTAGRKHFAEWLHCAVQNVTYYINKLERLGFLEVVRADGYGNKMRVLSDKFYVNEAGNSNQDMGENSGGGVNGIYRGGQTGFTGGVNGIYPNKYNINTSINTLSDSQAKSDRKRKTKVDTWACPSVDQAGADDAYTFAEFWNDYGHKVGSKTKTETAFGKLSNKDKSTIRATLPLYLRQTVTKDTARAGAPFRPLRQHPLTYLNGRVWETYEDQVAEQNEQATPYDDNYRAYLEWVQQNFPAVLQQTAQLSKPQFVTYKSTSYVRGVREIGSHAELNTLRRAHEEFTTNIAIANKYPDVFTYHCALIEKRLKARQV